MPWTADENAVQADAGERAGWSAARTPYDAAANRRIWARQTSRTGKWGNFQVVAVPIGVRIKTRRGVDAVWN